MLISFNTEDKANVHYSVEIPKWGSDRVDGHYKTFKEAYNSVKGKEMNGAGWEIYKVEECDLVDGWIAFKRTLAWTNITKC